METNLIYSSLLKGFCSWQHPCKESTVRGIKFEQRLCMHGKTAY